MAGIDLLGVIAPSGGDADGDGVEVLYEAGESKRGLAAQSGNRYAKIQRVTDRDGTPTAQGSSVVELVIDKGPNHASGTAASGTTGASQYADIAASFKDSEDPSKYMGIYEDLREQIKGIDKNVKRVEQLATEYESADETSKYKQINNRLDSIMSNNRKLSTSIKNTLQASKKENDRLSSLRENQGSSMMQWRVNQLNSCVKQFKQSNMLFERSLKRFNKTMKETQKRQIRIVNTDDSLHRGGGKNGKNGKGLNGTNGKLDEQEIEQLLEDPEAASQFLHKALQMQDVSDVMLDRLNELETRHEGMLKIEQSVKELHELWNEMSMLITEQQEVLDSIQNNVIQTQEYVQKGVKQLTKAEKDQKITRKLTCCLLCCLLIAGVIVVGYFGGVF